MREKYEPATGRQEKKVTDMTGSEDTGTNCPDIEEWLALVRGADRVMESALPLECTKQQGTYTLEDYLALDDGIRRELIDGVLYDMAAPSLVHQAIISYMAGYLQTHVKKNHGSCKVIVSPLDVQLEHDDRTIVQPDISVFCHMEELIGRRFAGRPDWVIEILSPSSIRMDQQIKRKKYRETGVREYWIVDPDRRCVVVYRDMPDDLPPAIYGFESKIPVGIWGSEIDFAKIYEYVRDWF